MKIATRHEQLKKLNKPRLIGLVIETEIDLWRCLQCWKRSIRLMKRMFWTDLLLHLLFMFLGIMIGVAIIS